MNETGRLRLRASREPCGMTAELTPPPRRRAVALDRVDELAVLAVLAFHVDRDDAVDRGHEEEDRKEPAEDQAEHDQHNVEDRRKRLPVEQQPERRQQSSENVDHLLPPPRTEARETM